MTPRRKRPLTLDDIDITLSTGTTFPGLEVTNLLHHGGPTALAKRLLDLAAEASPPLREALHELAHQIEPGQNPEILAARCRVRVNRQPDRPVATHDGPKPGAWGPEMAPYAGELWLRQQLAGLDGA